MATPGRFYALCVTPVALIRTSFGYRGIELEALQPDGPPRRGGRAPLRGQFGVVGSIGAGDGGRVQGGPDWIRKDRFTIEAVASGTPDAATMGGPMLRALFARRFKLKTHEETEQTLAYNLVVAPGGGLKIKPVGSGACEVPVGQPGAVLPTEYREEWSVVLPTCVAARNRRAEYGVGQTARTGCRWPGRRHSLS